MPFSQNLHTPKRRSLKFLLSRHECPVWIHISRKHLGILRLDLQRWSRISVPSPHVCASSRHMLPQHQMFPVRQDPGLHLNKLTAPQPQGPMAQGHLMTTEITRRRLDPPSNTEDEQSRSAVLFRFPCEQYHKGITKWIDNLWEESSMPAYDKPVRIHCKAGSVSFRLVFATRGKCQDTICRKKCWYALCY